MAMSLFEKARVVIEGNLHELLDKQVNTVKGYRQLIRDLEEAMATVRAGKHELQGRVVGLERQITENLGKIARKQANIDLLLGDSDPANDGAAVSLQLDATQLETVNAGLSQQLETVKAQVAKTKEAITSLERKHQTMMTGLNELTATEASARIKNTAAGALETAQQVTDGLAGVNVDNLRAKILAEGDVADARLADAMAGMDANSSPKETAALAAAKAAIEARRAQLAGKPQDATS